MKRRLRHNKLGLIIFSTIVYTLIPNNLREVYVSAIESKILLKNTSRGNVYLYIISFYRSISAV